MDLQMKNWKCYNFGNKTILHSTTVQSIPHGLSTIAMRAGQKQAGQSVGGANVRASDTQRVTEQTVSVRTPNVR